MWKILTHLDHTFSILVPTFSLTSSFLQCPILGSGLLTGRLLILPVLIDFALLVSLEKEMWHKNAGFLVGQAILHRRILFAAHLALVESHVRQGSCHVESTRGLRTRPDQEGHR